MKIAIVYDRINKVGGAEQVLCAFHELYPDAQWFTSVWDQEGAPFSKNWHVHASWINNLPFIRRHHEWIPFLMPFVFESFDFNDFDVVISIGSAECKGIITRPETVHINYCLTPTRYLWSHSQEYLSSNQFGVWQQIMRPLGQWCLKYMRLWDRVASTRPDYMISISEQVKKRVQKYYNRTTDVIYPPIDINKYNARSQDDSITRLPSNYYLIVSRLVPYKNIELAVAAFNESGRNLIIVGTGIQEKKLRRLANNNISLKGFLPEDQVRRLIADCSGCIQCNEEDFGIAMVEAQASGKPVIAYNRGGATEIITPQTGVLYNDNSIESLNNAVDRVESATYSPIACRKNAVRFDKVTWKSLMRERIQSYVNKQ